MRLDVEETEDLFVFLAAGGKEEDFYFDQGPRLPDYEMWAGRQMVKQANIFRKQLPKMLERAAIHQRKHERKKRHSG